MSSAAAPLRELHRIHQQLADLRERLARGPKQIKAREANVARLDEELGKTKADSKSARVTVDQKQLLLKSKETEILDLRRKLNACGSNREYQALLEQIRATEMAKSVLEDEIVEGLDKIDECQKSVGEAEGKLAKGKEELAKNAQLIQEQHGRVEADVARLETALRESEACLPTDFREAYDRAVKTKGSDGMAPVEGDSCGGCYKNITANMYNSLALGRVVVCQSCGRLLYLPEDRSVGSPRE